MTEQLISNEVDELKKRFEKAKIDSGTTWKALAKEFHTTQPQISRAIKGDMSPKSKVIREWLYSRLGMED